MIGSTRVALRTGTSRAIPAQNVLSALLAFVLAEVLEKPVAALFTLRRD